MDVKKLSTELIADEPGWEMRKVDEGNVERLSYEFPEAAYDSNCLLSGGAH
jgi:hypothetical protein